MTADEPRPEPPSRIRTAASPEVVALLLVLLLAGPVALAARPILAPGEPGATAAGPSTPAVTATPTAPPEPSVTGPGETVIARFLEADRQLSGLASEVQAALDAEAPAETLADALRRANPVLNAALGAVPLLAEHPASASLAADLEAVYGGALESNRETLRASTSNADAYRRGARAFVDAVEPLADLDVRLRALPGDAPPAGPTASGEGQPAGG